MRPIHKTRLQLLIEDWHYWRKESGINCYTENFLYNFFDFEGKTNLLAVLIQQFRNLSTETPYPVNFLLFDYKGEFSDPANANWLVHFDVDRSCILDPVKQPLPFLSIQGFYGQDDH